MSTPRLNLELPSNTPADIKLIELLNDRFRQIRDAVDGSIVLTDNLDAGGFKILNLADPDPKRLKSALNLQFADRRYLNQSSGGGLDLAPLRKVDQALAGRISALEARILALEAGAGSGADKTPADYTLTASTTNIASPGAPDFDGQKFFVRITSDATAGRLITWDAVFKGVSADMIDNHVGSLAGYFLFVGMGSDWLLAGLPILGVA